MIGFYIGLGFIGPLLFGIFSLCELIGERARLLHATAVIDRVSFVQGSTQAALSHLKSKDLLGPSAKLHQTSLETQIHFQGIHLREPRLLP